MNQDQLEQPAMIVAATVNCKTMADDTLRLTVDIEPNDAQQAFKMFGKRGSTVAIARLTDEAAKADMQAKAAGAKGPYSKQAQLLYQSDFFKWPDVLDKIEIDSDDFEYPPRDDSPDWGWNTLKLILKHEHWYDVPPETLLNWAKKHGIDWKLPNAYKNYETGLR